MIGGGRFIARGTKMPLASERMMKKMPHGKEMPMGPKHVRMSEKVETNPRRSYGGRPKREGE